MRDILDNDLQMVLSGTLEMLSVIEKMLPIAADILLQGHATRLTEVKALDREVDAYETRLEAECLRIIALHQPVARDLRQVGLILKSLSDIERMGDYVVHVAEDGAELAPRPLLGHSNLRRMLERLSEMVVSLKNALNTRDLEAARHTLQMDDEVDELYELGQRELLTYMLEDPRNISRSLSVMRLGRSMERVGDHIENVAERMEYWLTGQRPAENTA